MKQNNKTMPIKKYIFVYAALVVVSILLDQFSKIWMNRLLEGGKIIKVLGNWMTFAWTINHGAAFGSMSHSPILFFICTILGLPVFGFFWWRSRTRHPFGQIGFAFMIGGTIGNAIDRAFLGDAFFNGGVRDFVSVQGFAIFNVADCFLVVGIIMVCIALMFLDWDAVFVKSKPAQDEQQSTDTESIDD